jgi:hypothetical protein
MATSPYRSDSLNSLIAKYQRPLDSPDYGSEGYSLDSSSVPDYGDDNLDSLIQKYSTSTKPEDLPRDLPRPPKLESLADFAGTVGHIVGSVPGVKEFGGLMGSMYRGVGTATGLAAGALQGDPLKYNYLPYEEEQKGLGADVAGAFGLGGTQLVTPTPFEVARRGVEEAATEAGGGIAPTPEQKQAFARANPYWAGGEAVAEVAGELGSQMGIPGTRLQGLDPVISGLGALSKIAGEGAAAAKMAALARRAGGLTPEAAAVANEIATLGERAGMAQKALGAAFVPGMAQGALEAAPATMQAIQQHGAWSPEAIKTGGHGLSSAAFAGLGGLHAVGGLAGGVEGVPRSLDEIPAREPLTRDAWLARRQPPVEVPPPLPPAPIAPEEWAGEAPVVPVNLIPPEQVRLDLMRAQGVPEIAPDIAPEQPQEAPALSKAEEARIKTAQGRATALDEQDMLRVAKQAEEEAAPFRAALAKVAEIEDADARTAARRAIEEEIAKRAKRAKRNQRKQDEAEAASLEEVLIQRGLRNTAPNVPPVILPEGWTVEEVKRRGHKSEFVVADHEDTVRAVTGSREEGEAFARKAVAEPETFIENTEGTRGSREPIKREPGVDNEPFYQQPISEQLTPEEKTAIFNTFGPSGRGDGDINATFKTVEEAREYARPLLEGTAKSTAERKAAVAKAKAQPGVAAPVEEFETGTAWSAADVPDAEAVSSLKSAAERLRQGKSKASAGIDDPRLRGIGPKGLVTAIDEDADNPVYVMAKEAMKAQIADAKDTYGVTHPKDLARQREQARAENEAERAAIQGGEVGDVDFDPGKFAIRPAPGQKGIPGVKEDVAPAETKKEAPKQKSMFGGEMFQGVEKKVPEGREAEGPLFKQGDASRAKEEAGRQTKLPEGSRPAKISPEAAARIREAGFKVDESSIDRGEKAAISTEAEIKASWDEIRKKAEARIAERKGREGLVARAKEHFPGLAIKETESGVEVPLRNGGKLVINSAGEIEFRKSAAERHGSMAQDVQEGRADIVGRKRTIGPNIVVDVVDNNYLPHEIGHVFLDHFATPKERAFLRGKFEKAAEAQGRAWDETFADDFMDYLNAKKKPTNFTERFFERLKDFFYRAYDTMFDSKGGVFREIERGDWLKNEVKGRKDEWRYAEKPVPDKLGFYSQLERVADKIPQAMSGSDMLRYLSDSKRGVKADELKWTGLDDYLRSRSGERVTPKEVQNFLDQNRVEVKEVTLADTTASEEHTAAGWDAIKTENDLGFDRTSQAVSALRGDARKEGVEAVLNRYDWTAPKNREAVRTMLESIKRPTKFGQYQLPGGENYRELLLTLPEAKRSGELRPDLEAELHALDRKLPELRVAMREAVLRDSALQHREQGWHGDSYGWDAWISRATPIRVGADVRARSMEITRLETRQSEIENELRAIQDKQREKDFRSSHFDEPNILAHVRFNERTDAEGKRVLFIEEVQSDWAQKGRREGFKETLPPLTTLPPEYEARYQDFNREWLVEDRQAHTLAHGETREEAVKNALEKLTRERDVSQSDVPSAPFVGKTEAWSELALKRMIRYAAENGFDRVAWTKGEQQAERYDLSKQVESIRYKKEPGGWQIAAKPLRGGEQILKSIGDHALEDTVGKEAAERIRGSVGDEIGQGYRELKGENLKVGGEGMKGFYDQILPSVASKLGKKFGAKVGETKIDVGNDLLAKRTYSGPDRTIEQVRAALHRALRTDLPMGIRHQLRNVVTAMKEGKSFREAMNDGSDASAREMGGTLSETPRNRPTVHSMDITPEMRRSVVEEGQSRFAVARGGVRAGQVTPSDNLTWRDQWLDKFRLFEKLEREHKGSAEKESDPYHGLRTLRSKQTERQDYVEKEIVDPLVKLLRESNVSMKDFKDFAYGQHAIDANSVYAKIAPGSHSGMSTQEAAKIIAREKQRGRFGVLQKAQGFLNRLNEEKLKGAVESGRITQATADEWKAKWGNNWVALYHGVDVDGAPIPDPLSTFNTGIRSQASIKARTGARNEAFNPVVATVDAAIRSFRADAENKLWNNFKNLRDQSPTLTGTVDVMDKAPQGNQWIEFRDKGEKKYLSFENPSHAEALRALNPSNPDFVAKGMQAVTRTMAALSTKYSIPFAWVGNPIMDTMEAYVNARVEYGPEVAKKIVGGLMEARRAASLSIKGTDRPLSRAEQKLKAEFDAYRKAGGSMGNFSLLDLVEQEATLKKAIEGGDTGVVGSLKKIKDVIGKNSEVLEAMTRFSSFRVLREHFLSKGMTDANATAKAILASRDMTVDFERSGLRGHQLGRYYAFFNAGVQGVDKMARVIASNPEGAAKVIGGLVMLGMLNDQANRLWWGDKDKDGTNDWDQVPQYIKENHFMMGGVKVPLPRGWRFFNAVGVNLSQKLSGTVSAETAAWNTVLSLNSLANPLGEGLGGKNTAKGLAIMALPTPLKPLAEIQLNQTALGGLVRPEQPKFGPPKPYSRLAFKNVNYFAKAIAEGLNSVTGGDKITPGKLDWSPESIEQLFIGYTGGLGKTASQAFAMGASGVKGEVPPVRQVPVASRFLYEESPTQQATQFYTNRDEVKEAVGKQKLYIENYRKDRSPKTLAQITELRKIAGAKGSFDAAERELKRLHEAKRAVEARKGDTKQIDLSIEAAYKKANRAVAEQRKRAGLPTLSATR